MVIYPGTTHAWDQLAGLPQNRYDANVTADARARALTFLAGKLA